MKIRRRPAVPAREIAPLLLAAIARDLPPSPDPRTAPSRGPAPRFAAALLLGLTVAVPVVGELWRSPLHTLSYVQIEKRLRDPLLDAEQAATLPPAEVYEPLPADLAARLGEQTVDYDGFTAAYLPAVEAAVLAADARAQGLIVLAGIDREVSLPWHSFEAGEVVGRSEEGWSAEPPGQPVPGLYLLQLAYPIQPEWLTELEACGARPIAFFPSRVVLLQAAALAAVLDCKTERYHSWVDAYLSTDRAPAWLLRAENPQGYWLQLAATVDPALKAASLPAALTVQETHVSLDGTALVRAQGPLADLRAVLATDPDLLSLALETDLAPSDERQGQIVAGNHNGTAVTTPGYRNWLQARGLLTPQNQQVVGIIDTGYDDDDGSPPSSVVDHHPDMETPERFVAPVQDVPSSRGTRDRSGHGTMVAGIIAGDGTRDPARGLLGTGGKDPQDFLYGMGIAPGARLVMAKVPPGGPTFHSRTAELAIGLDFCRVDPGTGQDRAHIVNNSYNTFFDPSLNGGYLYADNQYGQVASFFDSKVIDGHTRVGAQPTTLVVSAGNFAYHYPTGTLLRDSVASPATAKNVISVGATASYRPAPEPPLDCQPVTNNQRPPNHDAIHIARVASFSGRGKSFFAAPQATRVHRVRVKPDLVAPGVRVFSTAPYFSPPSYTSVAGCTKYYPDPAVTASTFHTYGTGTSFAAPVATGAAALKRKWFLDRNVASPAPSLLKAALIATADSLGATGLAGNDHRPSPNYGWGRVNLNRLTDARARFYVTENLGLAVSTGTVRSWTRTIDNPAVDTYVVLAWSDPPSVLGSSQAPLVNNLGLSIVEAGSANHWRGNNFRENLTGEDNGSSFRFTSSTPQAPVVDAINNVEAIFIPANTLRSGQQLVFQVTGENVPSGPQRFALYAYNVR